jgi:hypothetical protein
MSDVWKNEQQVLRELTTAVRNLDLEERRHLEPALEWVRSAFEQAREAYEAALPPVDVRDSSGIALAVAAAGRRHLLAVRLAQFADQVALLGMTAAPTRALAHVRALTRGLTAGTLPA